MDTVRTEIEFELIIIDDGNGPEIDAVYKPGGYDTNGNIIDMFTDAELSQMLKDAKEQGE